MNGGATARAALALVLVAGCRGETGGRAARDTAAQSAGTRADSARADTATGAAARWTVTPRGIGALRAGMTVAEARAALGGALGEVDARERCSHVPLRGAPGRVLAMIVDSRVARIEVLDSLVATDRGARIGDGEARIDSLYRGRVEVQPHKYTDGHYLVVVPEAPADSAYRLIFETDGRRVTLYRAGLLPAVTWVEGCA